MVLQRHHTAWTPESAPDQTGRIAVVTGSNSGIGYATARGLAACGAEVVLACRSRDRGTAALERLRAEVPGASVSLRVLDLARLRSVREFAAEWGRGRVDLLVHNAGVVAVPADPTEDGFEPHFGVNHLGAFALTGLLLPYLAASPRPRVVTVSSEVQRVVRLAPERLESVQRRRGDAMIAYGRSKKANVYFALELQRRADAVGLPLRSMIAIPGLTDTGVLNRGANAGRGVLWRRGVTPFVHLLAKPVERGAEPTLYAATDGKLPGGSCVAPSGPLQVFGKPVAGDGFRLAPDAAVARRLWTLSERLTCVRFAELDRTSSESGPEHLG
ncbi:SDR family NAD(P)-dependent oxidoreductase [Streptomyces coeruleorubidus]|uniref:SDR family NAD(P)-dependent oxidoreductase n=1 Tax=Streptomyces coeruleorubidus TaxID=116188 RepID=UPI003791EF85